MDKEEKSKKEKYKISPIWIFVTLIGGFIIGIATQHIPEVKDYTDEIIQVIDKSTFLTQIKIKLGSSDEIAYITEPYPKNRENFKLEDPHPGEPISTFYIHRKGYSLAYDGHHHNPLWVYEHLTAEKIKGEKDPVSYAEFKEDENIPSHLRATLADYRGKVVEHAQMASPENHRKNHDEEKETYYLSNMSPQCPQFNQGYWNKLEHFVRNLTNQYPNIYVITGPLYLPYSERGGRFVKYRVIGQNDVAVPSHFFKVLILENEKEKKEMLAYIVPNHEIPLDYPIDHFRTTVQNVEKAAGIIFP